jgi:hypothetical protein
MVHFLLRRNELNKVPAMKYPRWARMLSGKVPFSPTS